MSRSDIERDISQVVASATPGTRSPVGKPRKPRSPRSQATSGIGALPKPTLKQRSASLSTRELMDAARTLAQRTDAEADQACTAVLEELQTRLPQASFDAFVVEIYQA